MSHRNGTRRDCRLCEISWSIEYKTFFADIVYLNIYEFFIDVELNSVEVFVTLGRVGETNTFVAHPQSLTVC